MLIADDGSSDETADAIRLGRRKTGLKTRHLWHEDRGFRKNVILNKAVMASHNDYLVFLDGDCIARADLIEKHATMAKPKQVLTCGSQIDLPEHVHAELTHSTIATGKPFDPNWLAAHGVSLPQFSDKRLRLRCRPPLNGILDAMLPRSGGFVGCNSSAWKEDIIRVTDSTSRSAMASMTRI